MRIVAYLNYENGCWVMSADGGAHTSEDFDAAVEAAHRLLGPLGGGIVYVSKGPGVQARALRIPAFPSPAVDTKAPVATPSPEPVPPSPRADQPAAAPAPDSWAVMRPPSAPAGVPPAKAREDAVAEIAALRTSYQATRARIEAFDDPVEKDIALGTLRLEAAHTLRQLRSAGPGLTEEDLMPLSSYVSSLGGGKTSEATVKSLDRAGRKVLKDIAQSLAALSLKGSLAVIAGILVWIVGTSIEWGAGAAVTLLTGSTVVLGWLIRESPRLLERAGETAGRGWGWASEVGSEVEDAMSAPREIEKRLWTLCAGTAPWSHTSLATRARLWAQGIVALCYTGFAVFGLGFAVGALRAIDSTTEPSTGFGAILPPGLG